MFCRACIDKLAARSEAGFFSCPHCSNEVHVNTAMAVDIAGPGQGNHQRAAGDKASIGTLGNDFLGHQPKLMDRSTWVKSYDDKYPGLALVPSAKMVAVKNQVLKWQREAEDDKIISESFPCFAYASRVLICRQSLSTG